MLSTIVFRYLDATVQLSSVPTCNRNTTIVRSLYIESQYQNEKNYTLEFASDSLNIGFFSFTFHIMQHCENVEARMSFRCTVK